MKLLTTLLLLYYPPPQPPPLDSLPDTILHCPGTTHITNPSLGIVPYTHGLTSKYDLSPINTTWKRQLCINGLWINLIVLFKQSSTSEKRKIKQIFYLWCPQQTLFTPATLINSNFKTYPSLPTPKQNESSSIIPQIINDPPLESQLQPQPKNTILPPPPKVKPSITVSKNKTPTRKISSNSSSLLPVLIIGTLSIAGILGFMFFGPSILALGVFSFLDDNFLNKKTKHTDLNQKMDLLAINNT